MTFIDLDRRFLDWEDGKISDPDVILMFGLSDGLSWHDLLAKRRVVLLAEAGSGKTEEMKAQSRRLSDAGRFAFYAKVQDVGRQGLDGAMRIADRLRLTAWRESSDPAWFFIDSVDEAKLDGVRLERALRQIADGIHGAEGRAHLLLSGRFYGLGIPTRSGPPQRRTPYPWRPKNAACPHGGGTRNQNYPLRARAGGRAYSRAWSKRSSRRCRVFGNYSSSPEILASPTRAGPLM
jgi:hypothetical protein